MAESQLSFVQIRKAFQHPLHPIPTTRRYRSELIAVMLGLVLLQVLYLLLIVIVCYLTWQYTAFAFSYQVSFNLFTIVYYAGPPIAGLIVTIFLLKPLVIRPPRGPQPVELTRENEPLLFDFIDCVCRALDCPRPSRVFADLRVNASASVPSMLGFLLGRLELTIGLPLALGMTLPQFAGVLAHEFGHFGQRTGMRSYFLIQTIQRWFARVIHQRDGVDNWLKECCERGDGRLRLVAWIATLAIAASRRYLAWLMKAGAWMSASFSRQMEFNADLHQVAMVGFDVFDQTVRRIVLLTVGANLASQDVAQERSVGRLPDNLVLLTEARTSSLSEETANKIMTEEGGRTTGHWDTHPCASDRLANARAAGFEGVFRLQGAPEMLFRDLNGLCRETTHHYYQKIVGVEMGTAHLVSTEEAITEGEMGREFDRAVLRLFGANAQFCSRWFRVPSEHPRILETLSEIERPGSFNSDAYDVAARTNLLHFAALVMKQSGIAVNPSSFSLPAGDLETIRIQERATTSNLALALEEYRNSAAHIARHIESRVARLFHGQLGIATSPHYESHIPNLKSAWESYGILSQLQDDVMEIRRCHVAVQIVRLNARHISAARCANLIDDLETHALARIEAILSNFSKAPVSVNFLPDAPMTIAGQLMPTAPSRSDRIRIFLSRVDVMMARTLGQLAWFTLASCPIPQTQASAEAGT